MCRVWLRNPLVPSPYTVKETLRWLILVEGNKLAQLGFSSLLGKSLRVVAPGGGNWPRKGVWGCAALKTPFSRLSCLSQGSHFKQKSQFTRPPFEKIWKFSAHKPPKFGNFQLTSPQNWKFSAHKPLKFGNFQLTRPQIWKFSAHKPPFSEANVSSQASHFGNPGRTPLPEKKLSAPPRVVALIRFLFGMWH